MLGLGRRQMKLPMQDITMEYDAEYHLIMISSKVFKSGSSNMRICSDHNRFQHTIMLESSSWMTQEVPIAILRQLSAKISWIFATNREKRTMWNGLTTTTLSPTCRFLFKYRSSFWSDWSDGNLTITPDASPPKRMGSSGGA